MSLHTSAILLSTIPMVGVRAPLARRPAQRPLVRCQAEEVSVLRGSQ